MENESRREKMALLGSMLAGLAHEINTPLAAIRSNGDLLEQAFRRLEACLRSPGNQEGAETVDKIDDLLILVRDALHTHRLACERLDDIARSVRNFARADDENWKKATLKQILQNALSLTGHALRGRIAVVQDFGEGGEIDCHPSQLSQVFVNLLINAAQAIEGPGEIRIKTWQNQETAFAAISDTGAGMTPEIQARIFEGFTTKEQDSGTGLGLSICLKTVQNHHGRIEVESVPGLGSTFVVELPLVQPTERKKNGNG